MSKEIMLKCDKGLFGQMIIMAQSRNLNMKQELAYSLATIVGNSEI